LRGLRAGGASHASDGSTNWGRPGPATSTESAGTPVGDWARIRLTRTQWQLVIGLGVLVAVAVVFARNLVVIAAIAIASVLQVGHMALRCAAWFAGILPSRQPGLNIPDEDLPLYSIIVPMRNEANMARAILRALGRLDYPKDRLDVTVALEHDDPETLEAMRRASPPRWCRPARRAACECPDEAQRLQCSAVAREG
jgi:hypothetical protein